MPDKANTLLVESIQKLLRRKADRNLQKILQRTHAADIAGAMRSLTDRDRARLFRLIPGAELQGETLAEADRELQVPLLQILDDEELFELLRGMYTDDAADLIELLDEERADRLVRQLTGDEEGPDVDQLLGFEPDTAGGIMSTEVFALSQNTTVREAIETLQASHEELEMAFYLYVVNEHGHLVGVCSLRQLVVSDADATLNEVMATDVISVTTDTDQEVVARLVARYNFLAVPVVDTANRLAGIVTVDDVIDVIREEATEDMLRLVGAGDLDEHVSPWRSTRQRMPWLAASFVGGLGAMFIIDYFQSSIERIAVLASFIPIVLGMGGNVGTQAATIVTRGIALGRINTNQFVAVIGREIATGALLGLAYGLLLGAAVAVLYSGTVEGQTWTGMQLAGTVSLGIAACMIVAATMGGSLPIAFEKLGIDPAIAAGPFVTTSVDVVGITTYFFIARLLLHL